jgi:hypothetical protein
MSLSYSQTAVARALQAYADEQGLIATAKRNFTSGYSTLFSQSEIAAQEVTISSFMIAGYKQALQNMSSQGIVFSL